MWATHFKHRSEGRIRIKSMMDLVMVKRDMLRYVQDVRAVRGTGWDAASHTTMLYCVKSGQ